MNDSTASLDALAQAAWRIRRLAVRMGEVQGQGYVGQALGWADVLAVAYRHALRFDPKRPDWDGRDRFLLSHGHYAIAHYAALIEAGFRLIGAVVEGDGGPWFFKLTGPDATLAAARGAYLEMLAGVRRP